MNIFLTNFISASKFQSHRFITWDKLSHSTMSKWRSCRTHFGKARAVPYSKYHLARELNCKDRWMSSMCSTGRRSNERPIQLPYKRLTRPSLKRLYQKRTCMKGFVIGQPTKISQSEPLYKGTRVSVLIPEDGGHRRTWVNDYRGVTSGYLQSSVSPWFEGVG
jgi:hypothetical protein